MLDQWHLTWSTLDIKLSKIKTNNLPQPTIILLKRHEVICNRLRIRYTWVTH